MDTTFQFIPHIHITKTSWLSYKNHNSTSNEIDYKKVVKIKLTSRRAWQVDSENDSYASYLGSEAFWRSPKCWTNFCKTREMRTRLSYTVRNRNHKSITEAGSLHIKTSINMQQKTDLHFTSFSVLKGPWLFEHIPSFLKAAIIYGLRTQGLVRLGKKVSDDILIKRAWKQETEREKKSTTVSPCARLVWHLRSNTHRLILSSRAISLE